MSENHPAYRLPAVPIPPDTLSEGAREEWKRIAPVIYELQTARIADLQALALLCEILADVKALQKTIQREGWTIEAGSGGRKCHPAAKELAGARRHAQRLLDLFGLVPGSQATRKGKFEPGPHKFRYG